MQRTKELISTTLTQGTSMPTEFMAGLSFELQKTQILMRIFTIMTKANIW